MPQVGFPYSDPGSFMGGIREQKAILNGLQADAFRSASQSQNTGQAARAFSGANVSNDNSQTASLSQVVTATNDQTLTISPTSSTITEGTAEVAELAFTRAVAISGGTLLNDLNQFADFKDTGGNDTFDITIHDVTAGGGDVTQTFDYGAGADGTTINDVVTFINNNANFDGVTASFDDTNDKIVLTADTVGARNLILMIDNPVDGNVAADDTQVLSLGDLVSSTATEGADAGQGNFDHNYLQRYIAGADAADYLSRGAANIAQSQGTDQSAFAKLFDFDATTDSNADNKLVQDADVTQKFLVELTATVSNKTNASDDGHAYNAARFREIGVDLQDQSAQAIFTSGQRQGSADQAMSMIAVSDGADADNSLTQTASIVQTDNVVELLGSFDLSVMGESNTLSPRSTDLLVNVNADGGISSAINSSSACQEQALVQSAAGGVDEAGNQTENAGTASNLANSSLENNESTTVLNSITILV